MTYCRADVSSGGIEVGNVVRRKLTCKSRFVEKVDEDEIVRKRRIEKSLFKAVRPKSPAG